MQTRPELTKDQQAIAKAYYFAFTGENGKAVIDHLEFKYGNVALVDIGGNSHNTTANAAKADVVTEIRELVELGRNLV